MVASASASCFSPSNPHGAAVPSQSLSSPSLQTSARYGLIAGFVSSQSSGFAAYPLGTPHCIDVRSGSPAPSPSASTYTSCLSSASSSSVAPSQSSSIPSQYSCAPGKTSSRSSSQSSALSRKYSLGGWQATRTRSGFPKPSASAS